MPFCKNCGKEFSENAVICDGCGTAVDNSSAYQQGANYTQYPPYQGYPPYTPYTPYGYAPYQVPVIVNNAPYIAWSIINIIFCCLPFGIWSLVMACTAKSAQTQEEADRKISIARTVCIISTCIGFVVQLFGIAIRYSNYLCF